MTVLYVGDNFFEEIQLGDSCRNIGQDFVTATSLETAMALCEAQLLNPMSKPIDAVVTSSYSVLRYSSENLPQASLVLIPDQPVMVERELKSLGLSPERIHLLSKLFDEVGAKQVLRRALKLQSSLPVVSTPNGTLPTPLLR